MKKFRRAVMWTGLALIILLILLSIYGAFVGADRARSFFNSLPLAFFWVILTLLFIVAFAVSRRLVRTPGLLLIHLGCVLVLAGSIWGSDAGHKLQKKLFGIDKIPTGRMVIFEGQSNSYVRLGSGKQTRELPFSIKLKDFRMEYYKPGYLHIQAQQGRSWTIPVEIGTEVLLGPEFGSVTVQRAFENFKIKIGPDRTIPYDDPGTGSNPALQVQIKHPDDTVTTRFVFVRFPSHRHPRDKFLLHYRRTVSDYISDLQVIENNKIVAEKSIQVNHPLHFGSYHFYQHSYDTKGGRYTVLMVVSDTGLALVYAGFLLLIIGVFWHLWLRPIISRTKSKSI